MIPSLIPLSLVPDDESNHWKLFALAFDKQSECLKTLMSWQVSRKADFVKIKHSLRVILGTPRHQRPLEQFAKKCQNPLYEGAYEARAAGRNARVMYFYYEGRVILTTALWKKWTKPSEQDRAFRECWDSMQEYLKSLKSSEH